MPNPILCETAVKVARRENGQLATKGSRTWGARIGEYLASVGLKQPNEYCAAFVYWCFQEAAKQLGCRNPLPRSGAPSKFYDYAKRSGLLVDQPRRGDIYITAALGHTGIVETAPGEGKPKSVRTIEGNTYTDPKNLNWGVHLRTKDLSDAFFVRL